MENPSDLEIENISAVTRRARADDKSGSGRRRARARSEIEDQCKLILVDIPITERVRGRRSLIIITHCR